MAKPPRSSGRPRNPTESTKVTPSLDEATLECLDALISQGYGKNRSDVARYLILREIDDLKRAKRYHSHRHTLRDGNCHSHAELASSMV